MTTEYVESVGRMAYIWGWALVNAANRAKRAKDLTTIHNPIVEGGMPVGYGRIAMLNGFMNPKERIICCPSHDIAYGAGVFDDLDNAPVVFQVLDFGDRFWVYGFYDARTEEFSQIGKQYGTKKGCYLLVGPHWEGPLPSGISGVVRSKTTLAFAIPRIYTDGTPADLKAAKKLIRWVNFYRCPPNFNGKMRGKDWDRIHHAAACWRPDREDELQFVKWQYFFRELPEVMKAVPALPGEEKLYECIEAVLAAAATDPAIMRTLRKTARSTEQDIISSLMQWRLNGCAAGNGWNISAHSAEWGTDYLQRTATAKSNMFESQPKETTYYYTDNDSDGKPLNGHSMYAITFPPGQLPPVRGFWSLTVYGKFHFFYLNPLKRYSLGTKDGKAFKYNPDGSLTLYASSVSPGKDKKSNWLPVPDSAPFSLYIRAYWPDQAILDGTWLPPIVTKLLLKRSAETSSTRTRRQERAQDHPARRRRNRGQ